MDSWFQDRDAWEIAHAMLRCYGEQAPDEVHRRMARLGSRQAGARQSWRAVLKATVWLSDRSRYRPLWGEGAPEGDRRIAA
jgi:hypothetical protein